MELQSQEQHCEVAEADSAKSNGDSTMDMMLMMMEMMGELMKGDSPPPSAGSVPPPPSPFPPQGGMPVMGSPFPPQASPMQPPVPMFPGVNVPGGATATMQQAGLMPGMMPQQAMPGMMPQQGMVPGMMPQQAMPGMMPMAGSNPMDPLSGADGSMQAALADITTTGNISNANLMNLSAGIGSLHKSAIPLANQAAMNQAAQQHTSPQAIMNASKQSNAAPAVNQALGALGGALPGATGSAPTTTAGALAGM